MASHLDQWNQNYADLDSEITAPSTFEGYPFKLKTNYKIKITNAQVTTSNRGDVQVQLDTEILDDADSVVTKHREWLTLPKQVSDANMERNVLLAATKSRRDNIGAILQSLDYARFGYAEELKGDEKTEAQIQANRAVLRYCDELHEAEGQTIPTWEGLVLYMHKTPNKKNADYPYTNLTAKPVAKLESFSG